MREKRIMDPSNHLLVDVESEKRFKFNLELSLSQAKQRPIFSKYSIFVTANSKPPPDEIRSI